MAQISEAIWKEILHNQKLPLIGTNEPNIGNGYNDRLSCKKFYPAIKKCNEEFSGTNYFYTTYLRDLGHFINPSTKRKEQFEKHFKITRCSNNYYETLTKYFIEKKYKYHTPEDILYELGKWGEYLSRKGRLIFEFVSWFDNKSSQFYGFELELLEVEYCKIKSKNIIYKAPFKHDNNERTLYKKVKIPINKCIIMEFPKELGGYKGFTQKVKKIKNLGERVIMTNNTKKKIVHTKNWDKQFNKIIADWGYPPGYKHIS